MAVRTPRELTDDELREAGYEALLRELGVTGFVRFIQLVSPGSGDYTRDRHKWLDGQTVQEIAERIRRRANKAD